jgi:hypothetical protein
MVMQFAFPFLNAFDFLVISHKADFNWNLYNRINAVSMAVRFRK